MALKITKLELQEYITNAKMLKYDCFSYNVTYGIMRGVFTSITAEHRRLYGRENKEKF